MYLLAAFIVNLAHVTASHRSMSSAPMASIFPRIGWVTCARYSHDRIANI
ncbi:hypothetical protein LMG28727_07145 [Paraburkholderia kirstenboschensis]|nr:hypothetical protein B0G80_5123 [Paraburkholderia sp. BL6669N2]CAD6560426.1 hypothetical protein LMG28727_07145 [Paraburkholderia kirstenboschensis]